MWDLLDSFRVELGVVVALFTIVVVGKTLLGGNNDRKRKSSSASEEDRKKNKSTEKVEEDVPKTSNDEYVEGVVAKLSELNEKEPKEFPLGEGQVLLIKDKSEVYATSTKCSHAGAPLKSGAYHDGRIRCPWHGACFSTKTGDIEDYPCVDAIHAYNVTVKNDDVIVRAPKSAFKNYKRVPNMTCASPSDKRTVAILGAGPAGLIAAETLRQDGWTGRIVMIGKEPHLPYDRTKLSKQMASKADQILLRPQEFFTQNNIETILGNEVTELDAEAKTVTLKNGETLKFDFAVIATGGDPRTLPVPGMNLENIYQVRVPEESAGIVSLVDGKKVVIVGTSFIGMEAAAYVAKKAASVIAIGMEKVPFERVLGPQIGASLQKLHEKNGVQFRLQKVVKEFQGANGKVTHVVLNDGEVLEADVVVVGAGIVPATKYIKQGLIKLSDRENAVLTDATMKACEGVYAIGDLARFPYWIMDGESIRVEHYGMAMYQGSVAAHNIMGKHTEVHSVPFFWTTQFGKSIRYAGHALRWDDFLIDGDVEALNFAGYYVEKGKIVAVVAVSRDPLASLAAELFDAKKMPSVELLKERNFNLNSFAN